MEQYYTINQVAEKLQVNQRTVRQWIADKQIKITRVGKKSVRISESQLKEYLESGEQDGK